MTALRGAPAHQIVDLVYLDIRVAAKSTPRFKRRLSGCGFNGSLQHSRSPADLAPVSGPS